MSIEVVRATVADWQRVRSLRLRALADAPDAFWALLADDEQKPDEAWQANLEAEDQITLLGVHDGVDAGLVFGARHHERVEEAGLYGMWVAPEARGTGLADALVHGIIDWARASGRDYIRLDVNDTNIAAQRLYARCGAEPSGRRDAFPPPRDHITEHELVIRLTDRAAD